MAWRTTGRSLLWCLLVAVVVTGHGDSARANDEEMGISLLSVGETDDMGLADSRMIHTRRPDTGPPRQLLRKQAVTAEIGELELRGTPPQGRGGHTMVSTKDGGLLLWGGCDLKPKCDTGLYTFDTEREVWKTTKAGGTPPTGRTGHVAWVDGTTSPSMWVFGGYVQGAQSPSHFSGDTIRLSLDQMEWNPSSMGGDGPSPRYSMSLVGVNSSHALVFGGSDDTKYFDDLYWFDVSDGIQSWVRALPSGQLPSARESHSAVLHQAADSIEMIVYGGYHNDECLGDTYVLNVSSMTWRELKSAGSVARGGHLAFMLSSRMYVVGGCDETSDTCYPGIDFVDQGQTEEWVSTNMSRTVTPREWSAVALVDRRAYMYGGCLPADRCIQDMWLVDFGDRLDPLQFVATTMARAETTSTFRESGSARLQPLKEIEAGFTSLQPPIKLLQQDAEVPGPDATEEAAAAPDAEATAAVDAAVVPVAKNSSGNSTNASVADAVEQVPKSRPGRAMMEELKEVRRQLKIAEDVCGNLPGAASGKTGAANASAPKGDVDDDEGELCQEQLAVCEAGYTDCGYAGCQTKTRSGNTCQQWDCWKEPEGSPGACVQGGGHLASFAEEWKKFEDNFGLGPHNFCRNPDGEETIWCYTTNASVRWELCDPAPPNTRMPDGHNRTGNETEQCPEGTIGMPLANLNLEMFKILMAGNDSAGVLPEPDNSDETIPVEEPAVDGDENAAPPPEAEESASFIEFGEDYWVRDESETPGIALLEVSTTNDLFANHRNGSDAITNVTVCFGKTGPVSILGNTNITLADLFAALDFNRTIETSAKKTGGFKPSPSPKPKPYNYTLENGMIIGQNPLRGKRRPKKDVEARMERRLLRLNCTNPDSKDRPECNIPFENMTDNLNASANWTKEEEVDMAGEGEDEGEGEGGGECAPDDQECLGKAAGASKEAAAGGEADQEVCEPDDTECLARNAASGGAGTDEICEPDDAECLARQASANATKIGKKDGEEEVGGGILGSFWALIDTHGPVILFVLLCLFVGTVILGAIMTSILAEKRKMQRLERSLRDAQLKQQDEVWQKSG